MDTLNEAQRVLPQVIDLRRKIHADPELGNHLPLTTQAVLDYLADLDLDIRRSSQTTSIVATLRGKGRQTGRRILLRGDMDALPMQEDNDLAFASKHEGRMHACGHDAHTAMLAGAARVLHDNREQLDGTVDFFFQTGEEGHFGAKVVLDEGLFDAPEEPDAAFALHITPLMDNGKFAGRSGPLLAAADSWKIVVTGKGGHASMPHDCKDPIPVACEIVQALQHLVVSRVNAFDPVVLTTTKIEAGTTSNVIPESATIVGTLRSTSERSRTIAHQGIARIVKGISEAHEMDGDVQLELGYPVTVNEAEFVDFASQTIRQTFGENHYMALKNPMNGAEDFSYLLEKWPGAMFFLGVKPDDPELAAPCHSNRMILNEEGMAYGVAAHAAIAASWLNR
ncbi:MAG: M20 metallopeptidase family protein [Pseudomonadales bacterium]